MIIGFLLFFLVGLALGYATPGLGAWFALLLPVAFAAIAAFSDGVTAELILKLVIGLVITAAGIVIGRLIDRHFERRRQAEGERA